MHDRNKSGRLRAVRWSLSTLAAASLVACGGGGSDAKNELPAGVREISQTSYPATSAGSGSTAATQDLLTGGLGKTAWARPLRRLTPTRPSPAWPSCAATPCSPTTVAFLISPRAVAMAACTARM